MTFPYVEHRLNFSRINNYYSSFKATCKFECHIREALSEMKEEDKCLPWYYPQVDPDARICSPFEARELRTMIDTVSNKKCKVRNHHLCCKFLAT